MNTLIQSLDPENSNAVNKKLQSYLGTDKAVASFSVPALRKKISVWVKEHRDLKKEDWNNLLDTLMSRGDYTGVFYTGLLLDYSAACRAATSTADLFRYSSQLQGWGEIDAFSYGHYTAAEILKARGEWEKLLDKLLRTNEAARQRCAMVFLCKPISSSDDPWFADEAEKLIKELKSSKDKLLSKAVSWLLRSMIKHHRGRVEDIIEKNKDSFPSFVIRELRNKLTTGTKSGKQS